MTSEPQEDVSIREWARDYAGQRRGLLARPSRKEVTEAVRDAYLARGYKLSPAVWIQIAYWVVWILLML